MAGSSPQLLGVKKSFGFGDRLGLGTPGHIAAQRKYDFAPFFAQQSIQEMDGCGREPDEVIASVRDAVEAAGFDGPWGANVEGLRSSGDVERIDASGFTLFTIDPSKHIKPEAEDLPEGKVVGEVETLYTEGVFQTLDWDERFLGERFYIGDKPFRFNRETLYRTALKYGRALAHCETVAASISAREGYGSYELETCFAGRGCPTSPEEHLFLALELKHRGIHIVGLAPGPPQAWECAIDLPEQMENVGEVLTAHAAIARRYGPYKLCFHHGSDKFRIYPALGRACGELLHLKTSGTTYLEALRVVFRADPDLFREILEHSCQHLPEPNGRIPISTTREEAIEAAGRMQTTSEVELFSEKAVRQALHTGCEAVLSRGKTNAGQPFKEAIREILEDRRDEYRQTLEEHFDRHFAALNAG